MTAAQATIRRLYEQVRVLEAEAARSPKRRTRLPYVGVLLAAVGIGAVSAGASHLRPPAVVHRPVSPHAAPVAHLIDPPAERARALPAPQHHRLASPHRVLPHRVAHHAAAPARNHIVLTQHKVQPAAPAPAPVAPAQPPAPAQQPVHAAPAVRSAPVVRQAAPAPATPAPANSAPATPAPANPAPATPAPATPAAAKPAPAKHAPPKPAPAKFGADPVGIGAVIVSSSDEPLPTDDAGATTTSTPTTPIP